MGLDPVSALLIGGTLTAAYGQVRAGQEEEAVAKYNARVKEMEARAQEQKTIVESKRQAEEASRQMSSLRTSLSASGLVSTTGTPLAILSEQARQSALENAMIGYEGMTAATRLREEAKQIKYAGKTAKKAAYIGAGTTLLTGFATAGNPFTSASGGLSKGAKATIARY
ncbi:MAG TPA: hypothetical protein PLV55_06030 [Anaerohalosphaeraceae bacterium]|nr:hypothetical protein [Anaerohalosphaeraceae bacterium]